MCYCEMLISTFSLFFESPVFDRLIVTHLPISKYSKYFCILYTLNSILFSLNLLGKKNKIWG